MTNRTKITEARARAFVPANGREAVLWDSIAPGLGLRVRPNGRKTWIVHRRCNGSVVRRTLGGLDALTVEDARRAHADGVKRLILPAFGDRRVDAVTAKDVRNWFDDLSGTRAGSANRTLAVLSSMMKHAEALGLRREDKGLRRRKTGFEAHYLTDDEFAALGRALDGAVLPDSKSGPRTIWLASRSRRTNCPWVFPSPCGGPANVDQAWNAIRAAAGLGTLRIHDLRHSHAAVAVNGGEGLRVVAGLLGHADIATTFGYAHLAEGSVFDAANRVSRGLADMLDGGEAGR